MKTRMFYIFNAARQYSNIPSIHSKHPNHYKFIPVMKSHPPTTITEPAQGEAGEKHTRLRPLRGTRCCAGLSQHRRQLVRHDTVLWTEEDLISMKTQVTHDLVKSSLLSSPQDLGKLCPAQPGPWNRVLPHGHIRCPLPLASPPG